MRAAFKPQPSASNLVPTGWLRTHQISDPCHGRRHETSTQYESAGRGCEGPGSFGVHTQEPQKHAGVDDRSRLVDGDVPRPGFPFPQCDAEYGRSRSEVCAQECHKTKIRRRRLAAGPMGQGGDESQQKRQEAKTNPAQDHHPCDHRDASQSGAFDRWRKSGDRVHVVGRG